MTSPRPSPTFSHQQRLPRLPIPDLDETCDKLLDWSNPLLNDASRAQTRRSVDDFRRSDGPRLQERLRQWAQQRPNWLEPWWDDMYLTARAPTVINVNYCLVFKDPTSGPLPQLQRAARLVISLLQFKQRVDTEELEPDQVRGQPLCMAQYRHLFSTTRVPRRRRDHLRSPVSARSPTPADAKHIVVLSKGRLFSVDVVTDTDEIRAQADLMAQLADIEATTAALPPEAPLGLLTTMNRDQWAEAREQLIAADERNGRCLEIVETALFALCLDETSPSDAEELARQTLHGDGRNRWFDKSLQLIVCRNGKAALNGEHSGHDATTSLRLVADIHADQTQASDGDVPGPVDGEANPAQPLEFRLDESLHATLRTAAEEFDQLVADTTIGVLSFDDFGKNGITALDIGPDTFVQLAIQAAQHQLFGLNYSTYESVMTRQFLHGRTEAMRSVTPEVVRFAKTLAAAEHGDDARADPAARDALRAAASAHRERVTSCRAGHGVERHLLGLLKTYECFGAELGMHDQPEVFTSPGWLALRHDTLSTSNGSSDAVDLFCFGPSVDDGFGVAYVIQRDRIGFAVTSRSTMRQANQDIRGYLRESLLAMAKVLN